jgi:hypothetical protein
VQGDFGMRLIITIALAGMINLIGATQLLAQVAQYSCSVVHFLNSDNDREFERINRDKKFEIAFENDRAFVKTICPSCNDSYTVFQLFHETELGIYGVEANGLGIRTIAVNTIRGEATMSYHTAYKVTVWELACR